MEKKFKTLSAVILAGLLLGLLGYAVWNYVNKKPAKKPAQGILMAQECGLDGLKCCAGEPKCSFGQECCIDANKADNSQCADKCGCGQQDEFCCANNKCDQGQACINSKCTACGGEGQPCCSNNCSGNDKKGHELKCWSDKCVGCGLIGSPCCGSDQCFGLETPEKTLAECIAGKCRICGGNQEPACLGKQKCLDDYLLNNSNCFKCGEINEPCCEGQKCNQKFKLNCRQGFCQ